MAKKPDKHPGTKPKPRPPIKKTLQEFLQWWREGRHQEVSDAELRVIAARIRENTEALSSLSTYPPEVVTPPAPSEEVPPMTTSPGQSVNDALVEQTQAIANLGTELANEHQQWLDAVSAGDQGQAQAIVDQVQANTAKLNEYIATLTESNPGAHPDNTLPGAGSAGGEHPDNTLPGPGSEGGAVPDNTLPNEIPVEGEPDVPDPRGRRNR